MRRDDGRTKTGGPDGHVAAASRWRTPGFDVRYQRPANATRANVGRVGGAPRKIGFVNGSHGMA